MNQQQAQNYLKWYRKKTAELLDGFFAGKIKEARKINKLPVALLQDIYRLNQKGKKLRGALVVLGYQAAGGKDLQSILKTSLFVELLQTAILIHDDVMDQDDYRRGIKAIHKKYAEESPQRKAGFDPRHYGCSMAITAGDAAIFLAYEWLLSADFAKDLLVEAGKLFSQYALRVAYGQALDITTFQGKDRSLEEIELIMQLKTADYSTSLPFLTGARLAGCKDQRIIQAMRKYSVYLGLVFQIRDDILDIFGDPKIMGKPTASDLKEEKQTLLLHYLKTSATKEQLKILHSLQGKETISKKDLVLMQTVLLRSGAYQYLLKKGQKYLNSAKRQLRYITKDQEKAKILDSLLTLFFTRDN